MQVTTSEFWDEKYISGNTKWDLGKSTPVFDHWIAKYKFPLKICVLGAGNGWDAINFSILGHDVTAVDFSNIAIENMKKYCNKNDIKMSILKMDIFKLNSKFKKYFDIVIEYTCFCAISPVLRRDYLQVVYDILSPEGKFAALLFPIDKTTTDGPPYAIEIDYIVPLISSYMNLVEINIPINSVPMRQDREIFVLYEK